MEPAHARIPFGAEFTIAGVKIVGPGRFTTACKPGEETVLVNSHRESVFKLRMQSNWQRSNKQATALALGHAEFLWSNPEHRLAKIR